MKKIRDNVRNIELKPDIGEHIYNANGIEIRPMLHVSWDSNNKRKIVAIGINPSTANDKTSDNTLTRLCKLLDMYGLSDLTMINLFESSSPHVKDIRKSTRTDFNKHKELFNEAYMILLVWGRGSKYSEEKKAALKFLEEYKDKLYCIADMKNGKERRFLHPSRISYNATITVIE